ncbi:HalOD1 output domain-containing protein (plasmid) [Halorientalis pallida]|uniref:HalOD1 output domain-containing protein n=1 Tax=Halorientalis pallida TaxID=2479928 RepID=UPI003C6F5DBA
MRRHATDFQPTSGRRAEQVYCVTHDEATPGGLMATLAHAVADVAGLDVTVVELAVGDRVDPAALDRLFRASGSQPAHGSLSLGFDLWGYAVTVRSDGRIEIRPPDTTRPSRGPPGSGGPQPPSRT